MVDVGAACCAGMEGWAVMVGVGWTAVVCITGADGIAVSTAGMLVANSCSEAPHSAQNFFPSSLLPQ